MHLRLDESVQLKNRKSTMQVAADVFEEMKLLRQPNAGCIWIIKRMTLVSGLHTRRVFRWSLNRPSRKERNVVTLLGK